MTQAMLLSAREARLLVKEKIDRFASADEVLPALDLAKGSTESD